MAHATLTNDRAYAIPATAELVAPIKQMVIAGTATNQRTTAHAIPATLRGKALVRTSDSGMFDWCM